MPKEIAFDGVDQASTFLGALVDVVFENENETFLHKLFTLHYDFITTLMVKLVQPCWNSPDTFNAYENDP